MVWPLSCILVFYFIVTLQLSSPSAAQNSGKLSVGQSLSAEVNGKSSSLLSPSGDFAFGFHQLPNNSNFFLLSIWYAKIPDTIVWYPNDVNPVPQGSTVSVTGSYGLVLSDSQGNQLWTSASDGGNGYLNDTGNFVLKSTSSDATVWQTFDHPADTLLPTQVLEAGSEIDSRLSETNFTRGRFQLRMQNDGNLVLYTTDLDTRNDYSAYYATGTWDTNQTHMGDKLMYDASGHMYVLLKNGSMFSLTAQVDLPSALSNYQRVTLDVDGVLTWYYHPRTWTGSKGGGWTRILNVPDNICARIGGDSDIGACGYNSICSIVDQRPNCQCPQNYVAMNPADMNGRIGSCEPVFMPYLCEGAFSSKGEYNLVSLVNTNFPSGDYATLKPYTEDKCKDSCLNDCFCAVAIYDGSTSSCYKKKLPLTRGYQDSTVSETTWLKVGTRNDSIQLTDPSSPTTKTHMRNVVITGLLGGSVCVSLVLLSVICFLTFLVRNRKRSIHTDEGQRSRVPGEHSGVHSFNFKELEYATKKFKEEIGRGAFGVVYKGWIGAANNPKTVAVKKLDRVFKGSDKEFAAEVNVISQTHHKNLVPFIGFCKEEDQRLLVYEYMSNGTVADYLFGDLSPSWTARTGIAQGVAQGLLYLHEECNTQIIHCDIKPQNILIDEHNNARISDFGLSKLLVLNQFQTNTAVRGTKGYLAPEWFKNKPVSVKVDVYSFGVLLLEIICCRRSVCLELSNDRAILTDWAFDCYQYGRLDVLVIDDSEALNDRPRLEKFIKVALWCIQEDPDLRPTMKSVTHMLEGVAELSNPPCPYPSSLTVSRS